MENLVAFACSCNYDNIFYIYVLLSKAKLIFDTSNMAVGIKDKDEKLVIYADKIPTFNSTYWAT
ncbi:hypothetical protein [Rickettsia akari]|nr:hypothetical protein [Rickettsia akari]